MPAYFIEILVLVLGFLMLGLESFSNTRSRSNVANLGIIGLSVAFLFLFVVDRTEASFWNIYHYDNLAAFYKGLIILSTLLVIVMGRNFSPVLKRYTSDCNEASGIGEYYCIPIFVCCGLMWMASSKDLITIFVSLELATIGFYVLVSFMRRNVGSLEAGVKYLILGALSTGFFVYGIAWLYGSTGSFELDEIKKIIESGSVEKAPIIFAIALIVVGLAFKIAAVPFHIWVPDVYQGTSMPITAYLSVASKAAGFIVLIRVMDTFMYSQVTAGPCVLLVSVLAALTLIIGNFSAINQTNLKRLLAYSSIAHAGFLIMAIPAMDKNIASTILGPSAVESISFYLAGYLLMSMLCFLIMTIIRVSSDSENIDSLNGLASRSPFLAFSMTVGIASLAGVPLTVGFLGKFMVFNVAIQHAMSTGYWFVVVFAVLGATAGFYYYFKVIKSIYFNAPQTDDSESLDLNSLSKFIIMSLVALVLILGLFPDFIMRFL